MFKTSKTAQVIKELQLGPPLCDGMGLDCYAPTNEAEEEDKDDFYEQPTWSPKSHNMTCCCMITGDLNAKVGDDNTWREDAMGRHGCDLSNCDNRRDTAC
ncbi:hypothetical protein ACROYT_G022560 [Oculina patagonica]